MIAARVLGHLETEQLARLPEHPGHLRPHLRAFLQRRSGERFAILVVGVTTGLFNVAVLALMMAMSVPERVALFMAAWTVSHALADGLATAGGGAIQELVVGAGSNDAAAYASVFAIGLALCIPLLRAITTSATDVAAASARRSVAALGWLRDG